jgi:hypothetical protein
MNKKEIENFVEDVEFALRVNKIDAPDIEGLLFDLEELSWLQAREIVEEVRHRLKVFYHLTIES